MKLSVWSSYYVELSPEDAVKRFTENGIYCSELSDEHGLMLLNRSDNVLETAKSFSDFLAKNNFEMTQGHLFLKAKICTDDNAVKTLYRWIDLYHAIGVKNMVLHCDNMVGTPLSKSEKTERNVEKLKALAEYVKDKDVTICLENLRPHSAEETELVDGSVDDLLNIIKKIGSDRFGICLDTGHIHLQRKSYRGYIPVVKNRIKALHIHDNSQDGDLHLMPYAGTVNWDEFLTELNKIGYDGDVSFETVSQIKRKRIPDALVPDFMGLMARIASYFRDRIQEK